MAFKLSALASGAKKRSASSGLPLPPLGSFDPSIYLQYGQNQRSAADAQDTFDLNKTQAEDNYGIQVGRTNQSASQNLSDLATSHDRALGDLGTSYGRTTTDLATSAARAGQDHATSLADLALNYQRLGNREGQAARQANVESGGILAHAAAIRGANQAHDQAPIDQAYSRTMADNASAGQRAQQDYQTQTGRTEQDYSTGVDRTKQSRDWSLGDLALGLSRQYGSGRGGQPLGSATLGLTQAKNTALSNNIDLGTVASQQAAANGYSAPPTRKKRQLIV